MRWFMLLALLSTGCNAVLGIEEGKLSVDAGRSECLLNSDCAVRSHVCIFRVCSPPCKEASDCAGGLACLRTDEGTACVDPDDSTCKDGADDACPKGTRCSDGSCYATCDASEKDACVTGQSCRQGVCRDDPKDGGATDGGDSGGTDAGDGGMTPACESGTARCDHNLLQTCVDGSWDVGRPCAYACIGGACGGECVPEAKDCLNGLSPRTCDRNAQWVEGQTCPAVCVDGACAASCAEGAKQCSGLDLLTCEANGTWGPPEPCMFKCDAVSDACTGECAPDSQQCVGRDLQHCNAGALWSTVATCPNVCEAHPTEPMMFRCGGMCPPNSTRCDSVTDLATCDSAGEWDPPVTCMNRACGGIPAGCIGDCSPGSAQCQDGATLQVCDNFGAYASTDCAASNDTCVASGLSASCTGDCAVGRQQCSNNRVQTCDASGAWGDTDNCTSTSETCMPSGVTATCGGSCAPGQTACIFNNVHGCSGGAFTLSQDCNAPSQICRAGACVANDPYTVGAATAPSWADFNPSNDTWYVVPIVASATANVQAMRLLVRTGVAGAQGRLALWQDNAGYPGAFIAQTGNIALSATGVAGAPPSPAAAQVIGGNTYWIGAKFTGSPALYQNTSSTLDPYYFGQAFGTNPATSMNPFPAGAGMQADRNYNFYLLVQDDSQ